MPYIRARTRDSQIPDIATLRFPSPTSHIPESNSEAPYI